MTEYNKLVRDDIPEIIREDDKTPICHKVSGPYREQLLVEKLEEEVAEYVESGETEELADILEVVYALRDYHDITEETLERIREAKSDERGSFDEYIVLERVEE